MNKKLLNSFGKCNKAVLLAASLLTTTAANAQFSFDLGATALFSSEETMYFRDERPTIVNGNGTRTGDTSFYAYTYSAGGVGVLTYPKVEVYDAYMHTISIGAPMNLAISGSSQTGVTSFMLDVNLAVDINGGTFSKRLKKNKIPFGYYAGLGFGLTSTSGLSWELIRDPSINEKTQDLVTINGDDVDPTEKLSARTTNMMIHAGVGDVECLKKISPLLGGLSFRVAHRAGGNRLSYTMISVFYRL